MSTPTAEQVPPQADKKKRALPAALEKHKFQKGHKRTTPAASSKTAVPAANAGAVTVRRVGLVEWLFR